MAYNSTLINLVGKIDFTDKNDFIDSIGGISLLVLAGVLSLIALIIYCCLKIVKARGNRSLGYRRIRYGRKRFFGSNSNEVCPICLENFKVQESIAETFCQHNFHFKCLSTWLQRRNSCPLCQRPVRNLGEVSHLIPA